MSNLKLYSTYSDETLHWIIADAKAALRCATELGNAEAENKYADQINDACTVLYRRRKAQESTGQDMKTFFVFKCPQYYPSGGMEDFLASFATYAEARYYVDKCCKDWWCDTRDFSVVDIKQYL